MARSPKELQGLFDQQVTRGAYNLRSQAFSQRELVEQMRLAWTDITARAERQGDDLDAAYGFIYDGCVVAANALVGAYGHRSGGEAGHEQVLSAAEGLLHAAGDANAGLLKQVRQVLRPKRHESTYERAGAISAEDLRHAQEVARSVVLALLGVAADRLAINLTEVSPAVADARARITRRGPAVG